jgi:hypothetical protein
LIAGTAKLVSDEVLALDGDYGLMHTAYAVRVVKPVIIACWGTARTRYLA